MLLTSPFNYDATANTVDRRMHAKWQRKWTIYKPIKYKNGFKTGELLHNISTGIEITKRINFKGFTSQTGQVTDLYNVSKIDWADLTPSGKEMMEKQQQLEHIYLIQLILVKFILTGGARFDRYDTTNNLVSASTATSHPTLPVGTLVPNFRRWWTFK